MAKSVMATVHCVWPLGFKTKISFSNNTDNRLDYFFYEVARKPVLKKKTWGTLHTQLVLKEHAVVF